MNKQVIKYKYQQLMFVNSEITSEWKMEKIYIDCCSMSFIKDDHQLHLTTTHTPPSSTPYFIIKLQAEQMKSIHNKTMKTLT